MKILLLAPPDAFVQARGEARTTLPLGLACLAAVLERDGHEVRQLVPDVRPYSGLDPWGELRQAIAVQAPGLVGLTGMSPEAEAMKRSVQVVREALGPEVPLIVGGQHATCWHDDVARWPGVTAAVYGEGEIPVVALARGFAEMGPAFDPSTVPGTSAMVRGELRTGPPRQFVADLDTLPLPKRDGLVWGDDLPPMAHNAICTTRGCPYGCSYCSLALWSRRHTRFRSPELVVDEVEQLVRQLSVTNLVFHDPVFDLRRDRTLAILRLLRERGLHVPFVAQTRADRVDPQVVGAMAERGCVRLFLGIESGSEATLRRLHKPMKLQTIRDAVGAINRAGVASAGFFIVGFPWEDKAMMRQTVDFALSLGLTYVSLHSANAVPGSDLWDQVPEHLRVVARDFVRPEINLTALPDTEYRALFDELALRCQAYNQQAAWATLPEAVRRRAAGVPPSGG